jgi:hypothetical protein
MKLNKVLFLTIRVTMDEKKKIKRLAKSCKLSVSELVMTLIRK